MQENAVGKEKQIRAPRISINTSAVYSENYLTNPFFGFPKKHISSNPEFGFIIYKFQLNSFRETDFLDLKSIFRFIKKHVI